MRIGSLFSGIGGLELGLEWSGIGETVWQVERSVFCRSVLAMHWPHVRRYNDVRTVGEANLEPVDLICGGFPCQDVSSAGSGAGLTGARSGLWYEFARIVEEMRPRWVVVENVASGASRWVDAVRGDLERLGYATLPVPLAACDLGAPHRRNRVFLVAHADGLELRDGAERVPGGWPRGVLREGGAESAHDGDRRRPAGPPCWVDPPDLRGMDARPATGLDRHRLAALGNSVVPQCAEVVGRVIVGLMREAA